MSSLKDTVAEPKDEGPPPAAFGDKLSYQFDTWYTTSPNAQVVCLMWANVFCIIILMWLFHITGTLQDREGFDFYAEMAWLSWGQLSGTGGSPDGELWGTRFVGVIVAFMGMFVFSLICAFIEEAINAKLEGLRKGKSKVLESSFTLIIGWSDRVLPLLQQLLLANESTPGGGTIVVLADRDKEWMDGYIQNNINDMMGSSIVTRMGQPIDLFSLRKVNACEAKAIVVLATLHDADECDAQTTRTVLALTSLHPTGLFEDGTPGKFGEPGVDGIKGHVVCEVCDVDNADVMLLGIQNSQKAIDVVKPVVPNDLTGRLMILCCLEPGIARVFSHILAFEQNEFYFKAWDGSEEAFGFNLTGARFADICFMFQDAVPFGLHLAVPHIDNPHTRIMLNPPGDTIIEEGDEIIVIAEDDGSYQPGKLVMVDPGPTPIAEESAKTPISLMLVGFRRDLDDMISEVDKWVEPGSDLMMFDDTPVKERIKVLTANGLELSKIKNLRGGNAKFERVDNDDLNLRHFVGNPMLLRNLEEVRPQNYNGIIVITERNPDIEGMQSDSRTLVTTLLIRDIQKREGAQGVLVSEILDPRTQNLVKLARMNDFICANDFVSMALGQMAEENDLHALINEMFSPEGSEMHIKDIRLYAREHEDLNFWELVTRARNRAEVCLGWIKASEYDGGAPVPNLNPIDKLEKHRWQFGDQLVVLSED
jgi:hypothetical protein